MEEALRADLREILGGHVDLSRIPIDSARVMTLAWCAKCPRAAPAEAKHCFAGHFDAALADRHRKRAITPLGRAAAAAAVDWDQVVSFYARGGLWSRYAGPEPGLLGCRAPCDMFAKYGIDAATGARMRKTG